MLRIPDKYIQKKKQEVESKWKSFKESYQPIYEASQKKQKLNISSEEKSALIEKARSYNEEKKDIQNLSQANNLISKQKLSKLLCDQSIRKLNHVLAQIPPEGELRNQLNNLFFSIIQSGGGGSFGQHMRTVAPNLHYHEHTELGIYTALKKAADFLDENPPEASHPIFGKANRKFIDEFIKEAGLDYLEKLDQKHLLPSDNDISTLKP